MSNSSDVAGGTPEVSIGLPVYNGERFLGEAIDSLLQQTFPHFELVISDNASTDGTEAICREYAKRDARVRYIRQPRNRGAIWNWNFVVRAARGRFFKWASANDRCAPVMLEQCVDVLRRHENVVLCYGRTWFIDDDGSSLGEYTTDPEILEERPSRRLIRLRNELFMNNAQSGLIRLDRLLQTRLDRPYPAGDMVLMSELVLRGGYRLLPEILFYRRVGKESASRFLSKDALAQFLDPSSRGYGMASWRRHGDYVWSVLRAPVAWREKLISLRHTIRCAIWDRDALWRELRDTVLPARRSRPGTKQGASRATSLTL